MSTLEDIPIWPICTFFLAGFHCLKPSHSVEVLVFSRTFDGKLLKLGSNIKKCSNQSPSFIFHHCSMEYDLNDFYKRNIEKLFLRGNRYPNWQRTYPLAASMIFLFPLRGIWTRSPDWRKTCRLGPYSHPPIFMARCLNTSPDEWHWFQLISLMILCDY